MSKYTARITGTGSALPEKRLTNDDLSKLVDTSDEWIVQRTGIRERRVVVAGETTASLSILAAQRALEAAGLTAKDLDLIIVATVTPEMAFPSTGCFVAAGLGLSDCPAFDLSAACCGFVYAINTGAAFITSGLYRRVMVIGAETLSRVTNYQDRASCILFGDGAGAAVLERSEEDGRGMLYCSLHADGNGAEVMQLPPGSRNPISAEMVANNLQYMQLRGREVYKFAVNTFEAMIRDAMDKCRLSADDVKLIVPHQVNQRIIDSALEKLGIGPEKVQVNIDRYGNTSGASVPIALDEAVRQGRLAKGDIGILVAFGAGLTWANAVFRF